MGRRGWISLLATVLTLLACVVIAIPVAIELTPARETTVAGQYLGVGASAGIDGLKGPAELQQLGETTVDLDRIQVHGPLRPRLEVGPLVRTREADELLDPKSGPAAQKRALGAVTGAFRTWYLEATGLLLLVTVAIILLATTARIGIVMARAGRRDEPLTVGEVWHGRARRLWRSAAVVVAGTLVAWLACGALAWHDTRAGIDGVSSVRDLVGADPVHLRPEGPPVSGYAGAVIGDSRASRLGGPLVSDPTKDDKACARSSDSLAAQLGRLSPGQPVLNLACPSATIPHGLLGGQYTGGEVVPPQVSRLLRTRGLEYVVVMIGPNDLAWSDFLRYCYGVDQCDDRFTSDQFDYRIAKFDRDYGDLLAALAALPGKPEVVVVGSYDVFAKDADCSDTKAAGHPGLDQQGLALLEQRNDELNHVLSTGAGAYGFTYAKPQLVPLCQKVDPEVGGDIQGLDDKHPFHPTGVGMVRLAATVLGAIRSAESSGSTGSPSAPVS
ncbi:GDSL-type esterase/lipase family protein [Nocardioides panacisoli]|uniref:SGNH hydrolase-type esterase domain-containing protein n=1 Tax=Nocardioides panacisoli TaxID=627624 RepID=A0ABP7I819_9ACTN